MDHPLALQFRRAVASLTAAQVWDSARQYRGTARDFLIPGSLAPAVYISRLMRLRCILEELAWTAQLPELAHLIRREDSHRPPETLPRAPTQDQLIQQELLRRNDLRHLTPKPKAPIILIRGGFDCVVDSLLCIQHAIEMFRRSLPDGAPKQCLGRYPIG